MWFTDEVWEIFERCWAPQPGSRPNIEDVLQCLEKVSRSRMPPTRLFAGPQIRNPPGPRSQDPHSPATPPQRPWELDLEESAGIVNTASQANLLDEF